MSTTKSSKTVKSTSTKSSTKSTESARLRATARRASLQVEAEEMQKLYELEVEGLKLKFKKKQHDLECSIKMAEAVEKVLAEDQETEKPEMLMPIETDLAALKENTKQKEIQDWIKRNDEYDKVWKTYANEQEQVYAKTDVNIKKPTKIDNVYEITEDINEDEMGKRFLKCMISSQKMQQKVVESLQLPRTDIKPFNGDALQYWTFIRSFEAAVEKETVDDSVKLSRLIYYCSGKAKEVIENFNAEEDRSKGYSLARKKLYERFGERHIVANAWLEKLLKTPTIKPNDNKALRDYSDNLQSCVSTLSAVKSLSVINNQLILIQLIQKLPTYLQNKWKTKVYDIRNGSSDPDIYDVARFIERVATEANDPVFGLVSTGVVKTEPSTSRKQEKNHTSHSIQDETTIKKKRPCILCHEDHALYTCDKFKGLTTDDREKFVKEKRLCLRCLGGGHVVKDCKRDFVCRIDNCGGKHSWLLHKGNNKQNETRVKALDTETLPTSVGCGSIGCSPTSRIALPILPVIVRAEFGCPGVRTYAFLDTGSTGTFCTQSLVDKLGVQGHDEVLFLTTLEAVDSRTIVKAVSLVVSDTNDNTNLQLPVVFAREKLYVNNNMPRISGVKQWAHLRDIEWPEEEVEGKVELLIGQNHPEALIPLQTITGPPGAPYATRTCLGWTINGPIGANQQVHSVSYYTNAESKLEEQVSQFWKIDGNDDSQQGLSCTDKQVIRQWQETTSFDGGHYTIQIPFKTDGSQLPNNKKAAEHRLKQLTVKLQKQGFDRYAAEIRTLLAKGYAEKVKTSNSEQEWYLPHHAVMHPCKPDKVRVVFDCAAVYQGISLNQKVLQGPDLLNKLLGVLLRFRFGTIAIMGDIECMFYQLYVPTNQRDVLRFMWWRDDDPRKGIEVLRLTVHPFGGVWSPSAANYALRKTADDNENEECQEVCEVVRRAFYVDDCLKAVDTVEHGVKIIRQLTALLVKGGFHITKWLSNEPDVISCVPDSERAKAINADNETKALGVDWNIKEDKFVFSKELPHKPMTRRGILSVLCAVYDPMGVLSPLVVRAKLILQELARMSAGWDEELSAEVSNNWQKWKSSMSEARCLQLDRCARPQEFINSRVQLHHFCDASQSAYGTVSYIRMTNELDEVHCMFLLSRSRVAPLKVLSIPRLELMAAVLAVEADKILRRELDVNIEASYYWTDSMIVLKYIANQDKRFQTFVANRLSKIHEWTTVDQWHHVKSELNPADAVSRGASVEDMKVKYRWLLGPQFLWTSDDKWNDYNETLCDIPESELEIKKQMHVLQVEVTMMPVDKLIQHYSSLHRLKKAVVWILRIKNILLSKSHKEQDRIEQLFKTSITVEELMFAERYIVEYVQHSVFAEEIKQVSREGQVSTSSNLRKLCPILIDGLLCVGGRLRRSNLDDSAKHQVILPRSHHVVDLIVNRYHIEAGHSGTEYVLSLIRLKYWIVHGRQAVKKCSTKCLQCLRQRAKACEQIMADFPRDRVDGNLPPFSHVGVDYFGPISVTKARTTVKRYGCVFTCLNVRAVHIEIACSLNTDSFIMALQRFISRRGRPVLLRSDNGTNFVGGHAELKAALKSWNKAQIDEYLKQKDIQWKFNAPTASHAGGVWERQIRTIRKLMYSITREQPCDDESLTTLMCHVESIVNGRPITTVSDDPMDKEPLTPNHLLLMRGELCLPADMVTQRDVYRKRWRKVQHLANEFWSRWTKEYLQSLQMRSKWMTERRNLAKNDLVMVMDERTARGDWPLGRVVETYPDDQGVVRTVLVKTRGAERVRPIAKIALLESMSGAKD